MKRLTIISLASLFSMSTLFAQQGVTQCGTLTGQPKFPLGTYQELPDPTTPKRNGRQLLRHKSLGVRPMSAMQNISFLY